MIHEHLLIRAFKTTSQQKLFEVNETQILKERQIVTFIPTPFFQAFNMI